MTITFACPQCGKQLRVADDAAGKKGQCKCGHSLRIPDRSTPLRAELIPAPPREAALRTQSSAPPLPFDQVAVPAPPPQPAPQHYQPAAPPQIVVNVAQHTQATAVAVAGAPAYSNGWAKAALALAVLALLISWIPVVSVAAIIGLSLAVLLAAIGFLASLFHGGRGLLTSIGAVCVSGVGAVLVVISTAAAVAVGTVGVAAKAAADAERERAAKAPARAVATPTAAAVLPRPAQPVEKPASIAASVPTVTGTAAAAPKPSPPVDPEASARKRFTAKLNQARNLIRAKVYGAAERNLRQIIAEAPGTAIAADARKELDAMPPH
jgi:hypothetical protein